MSLQSGVDYEAVVFAFNTSVRTPDPIAGPFNMNSDKLPGQNELEPSAKDDSSVRRWSPPPARPPGLGAPGLACGKACTRAMRQVLEIFEKEFDIAMALCGCRAPGDVDANLLAGV